MKLGIITDEISQDLGSAIELARKYKLDGIELRSVWEKNVHEMNLSMIKEIKHMADDNGLEICGISAPFFKADIDDEREITEHLDILKKTIEYSSYLDTRIIRGFTFWEKGSFNSHYDKILERYQKPLEIINESDIILAIENEPSVFGSNAKNVMKIIKGLNNAKIKALWDPGNDVWDTQGEIPFPDGYEILKDFIVHIHLKDAVIRNGKVECVPLGRGQVDFKGQFRKLKNDKYDGYLVLETHYRPKHEISKELIEQPKGNAFSYLGDIASAECLDNLFDIFKEIPVR